MQLKIPSEIATNHTRGVTEPEMREPKITQIKNPTKCHIMSIPGRPLNLKGGTEYPNPKKSIEAHKIKTSILNKIVMTNGIIKNVVIKTILVFFVILPDEVEFTFILRGFFSSDSIS